MMEDLPILETEVIEPDGVDLPLYRRIGEEVTRVIKHKPGMLYVKEIIRLKYALKDNTQFPPAGQKDVEIAPMPLMPVDKCIADTSLLAEILLQKYEYHVPFYRQIQQYRHLGMKGLSESTLDGWFKKTIEQMKPLYEERKKKRQELARPILETMKAWMETEGIKYSPKSRADKAITYAYTRWNNMMRCLEDGCLLWNNNLAENVIRPITLGRKNYLFCGNHEATVNMSVICSLLATARHTM